jgi:hypothetical protein
LLVGRREEGKWRGRTGFEDAGEIAGVEAVDVFSEAFVYHWVRHVSYAFLCFGEGGSVLSIVNPIAGTASACCFR